ncbi:tail fiber assembly protein [Citrobacter portucalensis]|uniref:tail fiber assembly protein n=1 Tax=Citrobacter portucalensis TaxID=1639133 RepID=UPI00242BE3F1|nr:tail fiber assembly protein [Citrobacter portucalensis]WFZ22200.1 tail fiber assembly protein [Citrobacter portucalensis]
MQNIKNFSLVDATPELLKKIKNTENTVGALFLESENGLDWYEAQKLFSDNTVKIQYNSDGVIISVVDAPVPERGNIYAVSMLWPVGCSVTEIAIEDYPAGVTLDGTWKFNSDTHSVYQDADTVAARVLSKNTSLRAKYASDAVLSITALQAGIALNRSVEGDGDALTAWQNYLCDLRSMTPTDLQQSPVAFPAAPANIW